MPDAALTEHRHRQAASDLHAGLPVVTPTRDGYMAAADKAFVERLRGLFGDPPAVADAAETEWEAALDAHKASPHGTGNVTAIVGLAVYANNAAAVAGGLAVGDLYRTGADPDPVCVVH